MDPTSQHICTECGSPFVSRNATAKTCTPKCRTARNRRHKKAGDAAAEFASEQSHLELVLEKATSAAVDRLPEAAFAALKEELAPVVREALTDEVLRGIGGMVGLLPLMIEGLKESLQATRLVTDSEGGVVYGRDGEPMMVPDHGERAKALALGLKYTVGQPGLAPQPEAPETAPITVIFPAMPAPTQQSVDSTAEALPELVEGERLCDMCRTAKPADEFVGSSNRCAICHEANGARARAAITERTKPIPLPGAEDDT